MNDVGMRCLAAVLSVVLPLGALCAPLVHAHPDDHHDGHHGASRVHAHLSGHDVAVHDTADDHRDPHDADHYDLDDHGLGSGALAVEAEGDPEAVASVQYFVAVQVDDLTLAGLQPLGLTLPTPLASVMRRPPVISHSHDPPLRSASGPRAPPARLS